MQPYGERLEEFINEKLKKDLGSSYQRRDDFLTKLAEYVKLKEVIHSLQDAEMVGKPLKMLVDLGEHYYVNAKVPDWSRICVDIGFGLLLEMTPSETLKFIDKKSKIIESRVESESKAISVLKAQIKLATLSLASAHGINPAALSDNEQSLSRLAW